MILSQIGVAKIPISPDKLALKIAAGKFPLAKATITIEELTVEGSVAKKKIAVHNSESFPCSNKGK